MSDGNGNIGNCLLCGGQLKETGNFEHFSVGGNILPIPKKENVWEKINKYSDHNGPIKKGELVYQCDDCGTTQPKPT